jgi:diguanylate cyclase (GGDEF)-like protein
MPEPELTPEMMVTALNAILADCGYDPVPGESGADRLISDARTRADDIVAAARETAGQYTDAALDRAARTVMTARRGLAKLPSPPDLTWVLDGPEIAITRSTGASWYAAVVAAGVYLPTPEQTAIEALDGFATQLGAAADATPPDLDSAYQIGAEVVALGIGQAAALPGTLGILLAHLTGPDAGDVVLPPARQVLGAFTAGYAAGMQRQILAQQEALHRATQRATREFQRALRDSEVRYQRLAYFDPVTGLPNKARLVQRLEQAAHAGEDAAHTGLCLIDLAGLAAVSEQFGADAGDHLLTAAAQRLRTVARHPDYLLVRHGPSTFALLVQDSGGIAHLAELADRLTEVLAEPIPLPGTGLTAPAQARIGVVDVPATGLDQGRLLVDAEIALRQARSGASGWAVYDPQPAGPVRRPVPGLSRLHTGPPTYQPIVALGSGRIIGLHTRMIWRHPHLGALDLARIGQLTGDRATTTRLAAALLQQACREAMWWDTSAEGPFIGLDLPLHQIGYPDILELVRDALGGSGLPAGRLHLHLAGLDSVPAGAHSHIVLTSLADLGVRIVLDDFGTGCTSIGYLRELPVHGLRTPAALLQPPPGGNGDAERGLLIGLAQVAHALGLSLTVHGIDEDHRAFRLAGTGCDAVQGLRYGPPTTPHQVRSLLRGNAAPVAS